MMGLPFTRPLPRAEPAHDEAARYVRAEFGDRDHAWLLRSIGEDSSACETETPAVACPSPRASWAQRVARSLASLLL